MTPRMIIGCAAAILGFYLYSHARMAAGRAASAAAVLPADATTSNIETAGKAGTLDVAGIKTPLLVPALGAKCIEDAPLPKINRVGSNSLIKAVRFARSASDRD